VDGTSALVVAIMNKHYTFAKFMLDRGADPNVTDTSGRAALYAVVDIRNQDWSAMPTRKLEDTYPGTDLIKDVLARGAKVDAHLTKPLPGHSGMDSGDTTLDEGTTPLMRAARSGDAATMRILLEAGADPKLATKEGNTAPMFAAGVGYRDKFTTGTESEALEALKLCADRGMDLNEANSRGETALHGAATRGADTIIQYLAAHGAKLDAKTKRGFTPLDVAMGKDQFGLPVPHDSAVALLRKLGGVESASR
jgi:ankyrin repeat protein